MWFRSINKQFTDQFLFVMKSQSCFQFIIKVDSKKNQFIDSIIPKQRFKNSAILYTINSRFIDHIIPKLRSENSKSQFIKSMIEKQDLKIPKVGLSIP